MLYPRMRAQHTEQDLIELFGGYDHRLRSGEGSWYDTKNLSSDHAPLLSTRRRRADTHRRAVALLEKQALAYVGEDGTLYYNFLPTPVTGLSSGEKQLVGMGAYIVVFPDKVYLNTEDQTDHGSLEAKYGPQAAEIEPCRFDGTVVSASYVQPQEPASPSNGAYWIDLSGPERVLRQWSEAQHEWIAVESVYLRIRFSTLGAIGALFRVGDAVTISGAAASDLGGTKIIRALGGGEDEQDWILGGGAVYRAARPDAGLRLRMPQPSVGLPLRRRRGREDRQRDPVQRAGRFPQLAAVPGSLHRFLARLRRLGRALDRRGQLSRLADLLQGKPHPPRQRLGHRRAQRHGDRVPRRAARQRQIARRRQRDALLQIPRRGLRLAGRLPQRRVLASRRGGLSRRGRRGDRREILSLDARRERCGLALRLRH